MLEQYASLFGQHDHMNRILEVMYEDILEFHRKALRIFSKPSPSIHDYLAHRIQLIQMQHGGNYSGQHGRTSGPDLITSSKISIGIKD